MKFKKNLVEASLSRLWQHRDKGDAVAIISASRHERTQKENKINHEKLKNFTRLCDFGYSEVEGHYIEDDGHTPVVEKSLIIYAPIEKAGKLRNFIKVIGEYFIQDSVLFAYPGKDIVFIYTNNANGFKIGDEEKIGNNINTHNIEQYYIKMKNQKFVFESLCEEFKPQYNSYNNCVASHLFEKCLEENGKDAISIWESKIKRHK